MSSKLNDPLNKEGAAVPLPIAASLAHFEIGRDAAVAQSTEHLDRLLNDAATALAAIAQIYHDVDGLTALIPGQDVRLGQFKNGAQQLIVTDGRVYRTLSMRRIDVMHALEVLQKARAARQPRH